MTGREVKRALTAAGIVIGRDGDLLTLDAVLTPNLPPALVDLARAHKTELLRLVDFERRADALLLASTRRIGAAWQAGCHALGATAWQAFEEQITATYSDQNMDALTTLLLERERFALQALRKDKP